MRFLNTNDAHDVIIEDSLRLVRFIIANREDHGAIRDRWGILKAKIRTYWNPEFWDQEAYNRGLERWGPNKTPVGPDDPNWDDPTVRLEYDLSYYSDRWCSWRVAFMDRTIQQMMDGGVKTTS